MFRLLFVGHSAPKAASSPSLAGAPPPDLAVDYATTVDEALAQAKVSDMVLVSAALPEDTALDIVRAVARAQPAVRILVKDLADAPQPPQVYIDAGAAGWML